MVTSALLSAGIYHHLEPELNINPLELCFFFPTPMVSSGFCHRSSPLLFPFERLLGIMMTCLETLWHICGDSTSLKCLDSPRPPQAPWLQHCPGALFMLPFEESQESACGSFSPALEGSKIAGQAFPEGFKGIKEKKANTEEKCAIYSWNKVTLAAFSSPVILVFLKGLHTRLLPPIGSNHCSAYDLQLLSHRPFPPGFRFSHRLGKN